MNKFLSYISLIIISLSLIFIITYLSFTKTVLHPTLIPEKYAQNGVYNDVLKLIPTYTQRINMVETDELSNTYLNAVTKSITNNIQPTWLEQQFKKTYYKLALYLDSKTTDRNISFDTTPLAEALKTSEIGKSLTQNDNLKELFNDLPNCTPENTTNCKPQNLDYKEFEQKFNELIQTKENKEVIDIKNSYNLYDLLWTDQAINSVNILETLRNSFYYLKLINIALCIIIAVILVINLITRNTYFLTKLGTTILIPSILMLLIGILAWVGSFIGQGLFSTQDSYILAKLAIIPLNIVAIKITTYSGILLVISIIISIIIRRVANDSQKTA